MRRKPFQPYRLVAALVAAPAKSWIFPLDNPRLRCYTNGENGREGDRACWPGQREDAAAETALPSAAEPPTTPEPPAEPPPEQ